MAEGPRLETAESAPFLCQMPVAIPPRPRCARQCASCRTWEQGIAEALPTLRVVHRDSQYPELEFGSGERVPMTLGAAGQLVSDLVETLQRTEAGRAWLHFYGLRPAVTPEERASLEGPRRW